MAIGWQTMHSLVDRRVILSTPARRADAYHRIRRIGSRFGLLVFNLGTDHMHSLVTCEEEDLPRYAQALEASLALRFRLRPGFSRYHRKQISDQGHLETSIRYVLGQEQHHGTAMDVRHLGSNGPDLIGKRLTGARERALLKQLAPRVRESDIERILLRGRPRIGLDALGPTPHGLYGRDLEALLREAAGAAIGQPDLRRNCWGTPAARRALLAVIESTDLAATIRPEAALGLTTGGVRKLRRVPVDRRVAGIVRWQVEFCLAFKADGGPRG